MRILILHSPVLRDAPPDELDTLIQVKAIRAALRRRGHTVNSAPFLSNPDRRAELILRARPNLIFNLVESIWGRSAFAPFALHALEQTELPVTGADGDSMFATYNKILAKATLMRAGLPTPDWAEWPSWEGLEPINKSWIVKSVDEDCSFGLDDDSVVCGRNAVVARAQYCAERYGSSWFAEEYIEGREFSVAMLERNDFLEVLPIAEMRFERWDTHRPRIVGYAAKWNPDDEDFATTVRSFDWANKEPDLNSILTLLSKECWNLFECRGYARVDFRVDHTGQPYILEVNVNPCLEPEAGFAAAAEKADLSYDELIDHICHAALEAGPKWFSSYRKAS
jgi:D-alanine-D-alanine ligase